ncbi:MAG: hypothetical protein SLAVMIC_00718 [uncultured marine phage]|uniref:DUF7448 domain-containing protein n=1 Tax=uncultured marine phage TaxID=707152 RepID=A0A8D9FQG3_9VIRU|nr:MAG: hypothetical protein SLAVMIC_00718 [uncultured marine phage]
MANFSDIKGSKVYGIEVTQNDKYDDSIRFITSVGVFDMLHHQDCCECVSIEDICGDLDDLVGETLTIAEENTSGSNKEGDSYTWTFYKLASSKGYVDIRWYGSSNGYYSESVDFFEIPEDELPTRIIREYRLGNLLD